MIAGDLFTFTSVTEPAGAYTAGDFEDQTFEVKTVPTINTFTLHMATNATGTG
jgi:hypothetical protein